MKRTASILIIFAAISVYAQQDTISRVVTVERDFQPAIQSAGKINQTPSVLQHKLQLNPVVYSTYTTPLSVGYNIYPLQASETRFTPQAPLNGIMEFAAGYRNTHFLFNYGIHQKKKMSLNLYANHDAYWGKDALSQSRLGMLVTRHFSASDFYFGLEGNNDYFTYYGQYFNGSNGLVKSSNIDAQTIWQVNTKIGIQSTKDTPIQYHIQTGYAAFMPTNYYGNLVEHQVRTHLDLFWTNKTHSAGANAYVQNNIQVDNPELTSGESNIISRHAIRIEPFYEYNNKHIHLHLGVNIDLNVGTGELLSSVKNLSFAPSPNVQFEWHMMDNIFHIYAQAEGSYGIGSLEEYLGYNRYLNLEEGLRFNQPRSYTPVDAQVGFKIRPAKTLLIDLYGGYAYFIGACNMHAEQRYDSEGIAYYSLWQSNYQRWKVGANLHYHYRDILEINLDGNYYFYQQEPIPSMDPESPYFQETHIKGTHIFDRPNWDIRARLDVHIDSKWSIYSENYFAGSRMAFVQKYPGGASAVELKPIISLNLGAQYAINRWLIVYAQLNDYLNRKSDIFYGYQSQGIHFLLGVRWKF